jgi:threonine synthase
MAILKGLSDDGGLFVPNHIPALECTIQDLTKMTYQEVAYEVMRLFFSDYTEKELKDCINKAYDEKFDTKAIAPLWKAGNAYYLELFHGATIAFKDMALSILPHLLTTAAKKNQITNKIVILTATSGDTGKAALAGFADIPGTKIIVFYPKGKVSSMQERQMVTQTGANVLVVGTDGNFDDAQTGVKNIFHDRLFAKELDEKGFQFSSANSINIGRLVPQIVYYIYTYANLVKSGAIKEGTPIHVSVPTGNFGNILAATYAKRMGIPIGRLICASNDNKVLYDFFETGTYNRNRDFHLTSSPSMDILVSSNLERLIYHICGDDPEECAKRMHELAHAGQYQITPEMKAHLADFYGAYATQSEVTDTIRTIYQKDAYTIDPHTAVATCAYEKYRQASQDEAVTVVVSTASPYKFAKTVLSAIEGNQENKDEFQLVDRLHAVSKVPIPSAVDTLRDAPILHDVRCANDQMADVIRHWLADN